MLVYVFLGLILAVEVISAIIILPSKIEQIMANGSKIANAESETAKFDRAVGVLESLNETRVETGLNESVQALPSEKKVSGIVSSLTSLASSSGVIVKFLELTPCGISTRSAAVRVSRSSSSCENVKLLKNVSGIPLSMQVLAEESQLSDFVSRLHKVSPLLGIRSIDYSFGETVKTADIALLLFFQPVSQIKLGVDNVSKISSSEESLLRELSDQVVILP
jgi:Tfp pilus assembly protein PilO